MQFNQTITLSILNYNILKKCEEAGRNIILLIILDSFGCNPKEIVEWKAKKQRNLPYYNVIVTYK